MRKVLHRCFKISIFQLKTNACLLHASEFPKMCKYLVQVCKTLGKGQCIYQALINRLRPALHRECWILWNYLLIEEYCCSVLRNGYLNRSYVNLKNIIWHLIGKVLRRCLQIRI